jgi:hypothetical protein
MTVTSGTKALLLGLLGVDVPEPPVVGVKLPVGVGASIVDAVAALQRLRSRALSWLSVAALGLCEWRVDKLS